MKFKKMDMNEFIEKGYLQEVNRNFFHPLGLALTLIFERDEKEPSSFFIWDCRDDPEGFLFDDSVSKQKAFREKAEFIEKEKDAWVEKRSNKLGYFIQPIPPIEN
jgi:hypothetical protein